MTASPTLFRRKDTPLTLTFPLRFEHVFVMNALPYVGLGCDGSNCRKVPIDPRWRLAL